MACLKGNSYLGGHHYTWGCWKVGISWALVKIKTGTHGVFNTVSGAQSTFN